MDENNMWDNDNRHIQNSDLAGDPNMNDGEGVKQLKTDSGPVGVNLSNCCSSTEGVQGSVITANNNAIESLPGSIENPVVIESYVTNSHNPEVNENHVDIVSDAPTVMTFANVWPTLFGSSDESILEEDDFIGTSSPLSLNNEDEVEEESHPAMTKAKPAHNWYMVSEVINRQFGYSSKKIGAELFQRRCYGSLHCAQRLELMYKLDKHDGCVNCLNFNPSGTLLASGSDDLNVIIWDWKIGKSLLQYDSKHRSNVLQCKFLDLSGDLQIVTCARDGQVRLSQVSVQEGLRSNQKLGSHKGACHKIAVVPGQPHVVLSAGEDGNVHYYDIRDLKHEKILSVAVDDGELPLYSINAHPLNPYEFCVSGRDNIVRSYDQRKLGKKAEPLNTYFPKAQTIPDEEPIPCHVTCAIYNHNGSEILATYNDDDIYLFDVNGMPGSFVHRYQGHRNGATIKGVNFFGPKSEFVISGSDCGNLYIWEKNTEAIVNWMMSDDNGVTNCIEPHPQLPFLCTSGLDWDIKVWVPSCEIDPLMTGLGKTVNSNRKARTDEFRHGVGDNRILWMLFRHFRNQHRSTIYSEYQTSNLSGSSSNSEANSDADTVSECSPS